MLGGLFSGGNLGSPAPLIGVDEQSERADVKLEQDRYEVYVNDDYVGRKVLLNASDSIDDVTSFLHSRGLHGFSCHLEGDHFLIRSSDSDGSELKQHLHVFLHTR